MRFLQPSSSLRYVYHDEAVGGVHVPVETVTIGGKPLDLKKGYRVTLNNYLAERGIFKQGTDPLPGVLDLDALEAYVEAHSPLAPPVPGRLMRK